MLAMRTKIILDIDNYKDEKVALRNNEFIQS